MINASPLTALKTTVELRADDNVVRVYVIRVPASCANETLKLLRNIIEPSAVGLQHLRRFARPHEVQPHLRRTLTPLSPSDVTKQAGSTAIPTYLFLLLGRMALIDLSQLEDVLTRTPGPIVYDGEVFTVLVPLFAPTSAEQAKSWSVSYWPTVYKKVNPFGPHPSIISRAEDEIIVDLKIWMRMAERVALDSKSMGYGEAIGAVIVERGYHTSRAVALAGDGRWKGYERDGGVGNPMAHAVLRAIGMTAQKLKAAEENDYEQSQAYHKQEQDVFLDGPIQSEEDTIYRSNQVPLAHYLCHGLEIYVTHEPCVACSMALLHSRFARVIFGQRMPRTGGLCSDSLGHGLFWRKELNWSLLAWQSDTQSANLYLGADLHA